MKYLKCILLIVLIVGCKSANKYDRNQPPYFFSHSLTSSIEFAGGKITTTNGINFSKNGLDLYTSRPIEKTFENGKPYMGIFLSTYHDNKWSKPEMVQLGQDIDAYHPVLSIDNKTLYFNSRSHPDSTNLSIPHNIWCSQKTSQGWSAPKMVEGINSPTYDSYPTVAKSNNLYFNSDRPGGKGGMDIYISHYDNGKYQKPINIEKLNSPDVENDLVVDPNEEFLIFNRYIDASKEMDLYISYKEGNDWKTPRKLHKINSPDKWELTPTLSPDGKYFFYELDGKIMQIDLSELNQ